MINIPDINLKDERLIIIICVIFFIIYLCNHLSINIILGIIFIIIFFTYYKGAYKNIKKSLFSKKEDDLYYNNNIQKILNELDEYKEISPYKYKEAIKLWKAFMNTIHKLEDNRLYNYNQYFENAQYYLRNAINIFMSFGIEEKTTKYIDSIEFQSIEEEEISKKVTQLSKDLYQEGHNILYNLSLRLNDKWNDNPNIHNKEIIFNYPHPRDKMATSYDFFI